MNLLYYSIALFNTQFFVTMCKLNVLFSLFTPVKDK